MPEQSNSQILLSGRYFTAQELLEIKETIRLFPRLSRAELVKTICENLNWVTPTGQHKTNSCQQLLEKLERQGLLTLPGKQKRRDSTRERISIGPRTGPDLPVEGPVADLEPLDLAPLRSRNDLGLWNEYMHRYHELGYKRPFGAHQRYFIISGASQKPLGCLLFAAAAWALQARDEWIEWSEVDRSLRLNLIVNNTRLLIFPWVRVKNLASKTLALAAKRIGSDWQERYGYSPVLLETFVDPEKYRGTCYKAANWIFLGQTAGRGRKRWSHENNILKEKHQGYHYEHIFAYDFDAMRGYHCLMHMARMLNEMVLHSVNLTEQVKTVGIQAFLQKFRAVMIHRELDTKRLRRLAESPGQLRLVQEENWQTNWPAA